jgi:hypothetical protein
MRLNPVRAWGGSLSKWITNKKNSYNGGLNRFILSKKKSLKNKTLWAAVSKRMFCKTFSEIFCACFGRVRFSALLKCIRELRMKLILHFIQRI